MAGQPETVSVDELPEATEELLDEAATALANNLNRLIGMLPVTDQSYTSTAELEVGRTKRRHSGHFCWRCARPIWYDQAQGARGERRYHADPADCG